jgi:hypothetical protein
MSGSTVVGSAAATIRLSTSWQRISVSYAVKQPGTTSLHISASVAGVSGLTTAFYADDATLGRS